MKRSALLVSVVCVLTLGVSTTAPILGGLASATTLTSSPISWGRCGDASLRQAHARCGFLTVPLDYTDPTGSTIQLAVSRIRHTSPDSQYQGVMLVNPGGPGGSGVGLVTLGQYIPKHAGDDYDWIGFDPRGVGESRPALSCLPSYFHGDRTPYVPTSQAIIDTWLKRSQAYAQACEADAAALLPHMKTTDSAMDMDSIRAALGVPRINYFGFSYGTYLGQVYATLFPSRVRRMVFDSSVDPRYAFYVANLHQDVAFDRNAGIWFGWLARYHAVYHLGRTRLAVERLYYRTQAKLDLAAAGGQVGSDEWSDIFTYAGYYQSYWTYLASVFSSWVHDHDTQTLVQAYRSFDGPGDDNGFAVYNAVQCTDAPWPLSWARWDRVNRRIYRRAPFLTWGNAWYNAPCLYWPAPPGRRVDVDGHDARVLLIDETLDAATPYPGSLEVRRRFPNSSLIAEPGGTTHAGTLYGNACVDDRIAAFLAKGTLPPRTAGNHADVRCAPLPQPVPESERSAGSMTSRRAAIESRLMALLRP